jgi:hypothetical protein
MPHQGTDHISADMQRCIEDCLDCHDICLETIAYCLDRGGTYAETEHIRLLLDCVEICQTSADFTLCGSELHGRTCDICAEVCDRCAQRCESFGDEAIIYECAEVCRRCAESCRQMAMSTDQ